MKPYIRDLIVLLHKVKGAVDSYLFAEWMYLFVQVVLDKTCYIDWGEVIAEELQDQLKQAWFEDRDFSMSSYLMYCLACTKEWQGIPRAPVFEGIRVFEFYPCFQSENALGNYRRVHDVFTRRMFAKLIGNLERRISEEGQQLIRVYESYYIQYPHFTYLRVGGFEEEPMKLPRYAFDCFVLAELCRKLAHVIKKYADLSDREALFPLELGSFSCKSFVDAASVGVDLKNFNFGFYQARNSFDNKLFVAQTFKLGKSYAPSAHLEDFWKDCKDEFEVRLRDYSRLRIQQIIDWNLEVNVEGVTDNDEDILDPEFDRIKSKPLDEISWFEYERYDIDVKVITMIQRTVHWLSRMR